jgi:hypothetical protein
MRKLLSSCAVLCCTGERKNGKFLLEKMRTQYIHHAGLRMRWRRIVYMSLD